MPNENETGKVYDWTPEQAEKDMALAGTQERWTHGQLLPIKVKYYKWAEKDAKGNKVGTSTEITFEQYVHLPQNQRGQKVFFDLDPRVVNPTLQFHVNRSVMMGFDAWNNIVLPSIKDTVGQGDKSLSVFVERARSGKWFVEAQLVLTGEVYQGKAQNTVKFSRMTDQAETLMEWAAERYPKKEAELEAAMVEEAQLMFKRMAKGNPDKFRALVAESEDMAPYAEQLVKMAKDWA